MSQADPMKVALVGYGNVGKYILEALEVSPDMELVGVVRRDPSQMQPIELRDIPVESDIKALGDVDVALMALPSRLVPATAEQYLSLGINTVDSFDIHDEIVPLRRRLQALSSQYQCTAIISAGWDPGSDSVVRTLMQAMFPQGITYTDFGPGRSMGHTVAAKAIEGVEEALSLTIPLGTGLHRRMVYLKAPKEMQRCIEKTLMQDSYFCHDETHVCFVDDVESLQDMGHAVLMTRKGVSGKTHNQQASFRMSINNPALTAQIMVAAARASMRMPSGAFTLPEVPVIDLLPGERELWIGNLC